MNDWKQHHPTVAERTEEVTVDKSYDSQDNIAVVRRHHAELLCPTRKIWQKGDYEITDEKGTVTSLKLLPDREGGDLTYDQDGQIYCAYQKPGAPNVDRPWDWRPMAFKGYETDRQSVKCVCPAKA